GRFKVDVDLFPRKHIKRRGQLQAIRMGDFTAVRYSVTNSDAPFRLYNVVKDPHEDHNLSGDRKYAGRLAMMAAMTKEVRLREPSAHRPYDNDLVPSVTVANRKEGVLDYSIY